MVRNALCIHLFWRARRPAIHRAKTQEVGLLKQGGIDRLPSAVLVKHFDRCLTMPMPVEHEGVVRS